MKIEDVKKFGSLDFFARQLVEGSITGKHKSPFHGFSVEFAEHRLYNPGESTRNVDWKVFARTDRLYTKRYEEETNLKCHLILDHSSSMYYPYPGNDKMKFTVYAAAALSYLFFKQRDAFSLTVFSDEIDISLPSKSTGSHLEIIYQTLTTLLEAEKKSKRNTKVAENLHQIAKKAGKRSLIILFSDMFDRPEQLKDIIHALQHLKHQQHEILVFQINHKGSELDFDFANRPYEFIDIESGESMRIRPNVFREKYKKEIESYYHELKITCGQMKIDLIEVNTEDNFEQVLFQYLIKRQKITRI